MIWCSKSIKMMRDRSNRKSLRWLLQGSFKKQGHFFSRSIRGEWGKRLLWAQIIFFMSVKHAFFLFRLKENRLVVKMIYRSIYISPLKECWEA